MRGTTIEESRNTRKFPEKLSREWIQLMPITMLLLVFICKDASIVI